LLRSAVPSEDFVSEMESRCITVAGAQSGHPALLRHDEALQCGTVQSTRTTNAAKHFRQRNQRRNIFSTIRVKVVVAW
jgi:hypothetical protein